MKLLLSVCFLCWANSFSSLVLKHTKRKLHKLYLFTQCLWWHVILFKAELKNWTGLEWKDENDILTNVKNIYQSWLVHSQRLHEYLCSFNTSSRENPTRLSVKDSHRRRMKDGSPSPLSQDLPHNVWTSAESWGK